jgi:hypothetical protein
LGKDPSLQIMLVTYSDEFAEQLGSQIRSVMRHPEYKRLFGNSQLANENARSTRLRTLEGGKVTITSFHATMTGLGADYIIVDDPIQTNDVRSATKMNDTINRFKEGLYTRLNDPKTGRILLVMQRIHPDDLTGELLERSDFEHLKLPVRFEEDISYQMPFGKVHIAYTGDYLDPARFGELELARTAQARFAGQRLLSFTDATNYHSNLK